MSNAFTGLIHSKPDVAVVDGAPAEELARRVGILAPLKRRVEELVAQTGTSQRAIATYVHGYELIGAVCWGGFADPKDNGIVCCIGLCARPEDVPIVLMKLAEFFSCTMHNNPCPWTVN